MPMMLAADMDAINRYIMTAPIKTEKAKQIQEKWIRFWKETERSWTWYSQDEFDQARNIRREFDLANAVTKAQKQAVLDRSATGVTSEEARGEVRRATSEGIYIVDEEPFIPTRVQVAGWAILAAAGLGYVGIKYLGAVNPLSYVKKALK